ncbi:unnamed protein product [Adineta ricciae]|uniref:NHL repeat containing protein n=1 Tax=Adineta ricciae TaxID=249248 RepID=A0A815E6G5_ADIRI|nr:unnamed protein product [Adineta ricciae]CAF1594714.1 unnamed protein product [Adineta ricciae]
MNGSTVAGARGSVSTYLSSPKMVVIDNTSSIYVLNSGSYCVWKFFPGNATIGTVIIKGSSGKNIKQFSSISAMTMDNDGNIFFLDSGSTRITKWNIPQNTTSLVINGSSFLNSNTGSNDFLLNPLGMFIEMNTMIIWIADTNKHRIVKWLNQTTVQIIVGCYGTQSNQFKYPYNFFVDVENNYTLYVADTYNHRIQMFLKDQTNGTTVAGITSYYGTQLNQLWTPTAILVDQNQFMYIVDNGNSRILQWKAGEQFGKLITGTYTSGGSGSDQLSNPWSLTFDTIGRLYVVDYGNGRIQMYNITCLSTNDTMSPLSSTTTTTTTQPNAFSECDTPIWSSNGITEAGSSIGDYGSDSSHLNTVYDLWLGSNDTLYVLDSGNYRVQLFYPNQLSGITVIKSSFGSSPNQFALMHAMAIGSDGSIHILDSTNARLLRFPRGSSNGTIVAGGNGVGSALNKLNYPFGFFLDPITLYIWIADTTNCRVVKWMSKTNITLVAGGSCGPEADQFLSLYDVFVDTDDSNTIYAVDAGNFRIQQWFQGATNGTTVAGQSGVKGSGLTQLSDPSAVVLEKSKIMYIADAGNNRILRWIIGSNYGSVIVGTDSYGNLPTQLYRPQRLRFDSKGNLYVLDNMNYRVQKFSLICYPSTAISSQLSTSYSSSATSMASSTKSTTTTTSISTSTATTSSTEPITLSTTTSIPTSSTESITSSTIVAMSTVLQGSTEASATSTSSSFSSFYLKISLTIILIYHLKD